MEEHDSSSSFCGFAGKTLFPQMASGIMNTYEWYSCVMIFSITTYVGIF